MSKELNVDDYINMLKSHDWFYDYSDDHSVWVRGKAQRGAILEARKILDPDYIIWNQHCPKDYVRPNIPANVTKV